MKGDALIGSGCVKQLGRIFTKNGILWLSYSGSGVEFECRGGVTVTFTADGAVGMIDGPLRYARYAVICDGETVADGRLSRERLTVTVGADDGVHIFRVIKLSESGDSTLGIEELSACDMHRTAPGRYRMEFIGDSITCGYGVEGSISEYYTTATENVTKAWAYMTALRFGADYSIISRSGSGLVSGYTPDGVRNTDNIFTDYYDAYGCPAPELPGGGRASDIPYDHSFDPDVVFINLGTNDTSFCHPTDMTGLVTVGPEEEARRRKEFREAYRGLLHHVFDVSPRATVICMLGVMGTQLSCEVEAVVDSVRGEGRERVYFLPLTDQWDITSDFGTDYHPSALTQRLTADAVCSFTEGVI